MIVMELKVFNFISTKASLTSNSILDDHEEPVGVKYPNNFRALRYATHENWLPFCDNIPWQSIL